MDDLDRFALVSNSFVVIWWSNWVRFGFYFDEAGVQSLVYMNPQAETEEDLWLTNLRFKKISPLSVGRLNKALVLLQIINTRK